MKNVIVLSRGRAGSTSLFRSFNCHTALDGLDEPFNPAQYEGQYVANSLSEFKQKIAQIFSEYDLIKHTWSLAGWPFGGQEPFEILEALLKLPDTHFVVINRRDVFLRFVSSHISVHSNIWFRDSESDYHKVREVEYPALDEDRLKIELEYEPQLIQRWYGLLEEEGAQFSALWYEDFYLSMDLEDRLKVFDSILMKIGLTTEGLEVDSVRRFLDRERSKLNDIESYSRIPNFLELQKKYQSVNSSQGDL